MVYIMTYGCICCYMVVVYGAVWWYMVVYEDAYYKAGGQPGSGNVLMIDLCQKVACNVVNRGHLEHFLKRPAKPGSRGKPRGGQKHAFCVKFVATNIDLGAGGMDFGARNLDFVARIQKHVFCARSIDFVLEAARSC